MSKLMEALLAAFSSVLNGISAVIYDIVIFPVAAAVHSAVKHLPIVGPTLVSAIDQWLERLSADWPDKLP